MRTEPGNKKGREGKPLWVTSRKVNRVRLGRSAEVDENELSRRVTDQAEEDEDGFNEPFAAVNIKERRYGKRLRAKTRKVTRVRVGRSAEKDVNRSKPNENELRTRVTDQKNDDYDHIREPTVPVKREARSLKYTNKHVTKVRFRRSTLGEENSDQVLNPSDNRPGNHDDEMNYHRDRDNEDRDDDDKDDDDDRDNDRDDDDDDDDDGDRDDNDDRKSDEERDVNNKNDNDLKDIENKVKVLKRLKRGHFYKQILCARTHLDHYCN